MEKNKPHVSEKKKQIIKQLEKLFTSYKLIGVANLKDLPSKQLQAMKSNLKNKLLIFVTKKRLINLAIESIKDKKDLTKLKPFIENSMPALIFSNEEPFSLAKEIRKSKSKAPAKPGQIAPCELKIEAGPTEFPPGPIIGEFGQMGIIAAVENGKVCIKKEKILTKEGDIINSKTAAALLKLGIEPMEIGLNLLSVISENTLYEKEVLEVDEEKIKQDITNAHRDAYLLALSIPYITKETLKPLIQKVSKEGNVLSDKLSEKGIITSENIKKTLNKADSEAKALENKIPEEVKQTINQEPQKKTLEELQQEDKQKEKERKITTEQVLEGINKENQSAPSEAKVTDDKKPVEQVPKEEQPSKTETEKESEVAKNILENLKKKEIKTTPEE